MEAPNQLIRKQELERYRLIQQLKQVDTELQYVNFPSEKTHFIPSTSKNVPPRQVTRSEFSITATFVFRVKTKRQKRGFIMDAINITETLINNPTNSVSFEETCKDIFPSL